MRFLTLATILAFALPALAQEVEHGLPSESDLAPKVYTHPSGRSIRVVGSISSSQEISEGALGRVVETFTLSEESICVVVFEAKVGTDKLPIVPGIDKWEAMKPVVIDRSTADYIWFSILNREDCLVMAEFPGYTGSTMEEMLALPREMRSRILKTYGTCTTEGVEHSCTVPMGHPKARAGAAIYFPHKLSGRTDINLKRYSNGTIQPRHPVAVEKIKEK